jgi:hypothetical protein
VARALGGGARRRAPVPLGGTVRVPSGRRLPSGDQEPHAQNEASSSCGNSSEEAS